MGVRQRVHERAVAVKRDAPWCAGSIPTHVEGQLLEPGANGIHHWTEIGMDTRRHVRFGWRWKCELVPRAALVSSGRATPGS